MSYKSRRRKRAIRRNEKRKRGPRSKRFPIPEPPLNASVDLPTTSVGHSRSREEPSATTEAQRELLDAIAHALGGSDWFTREGFERYQWGTTPGSNRPVLVLDDDVAMSTFDDGTLGATYLMRGQVRKVMRYNGRTENGESEWMSRYVPAGDASLN